MLRTSMDVQKSGDGGWDQGIDSGEECEEWGG